MAKREPDSPEKNRLSQEEHPTGESPSAYGPPNDCLHELPDWAARDYLETVDGLGFALLSDRPEQHRWLAYLRYRRANHDQAAWGVWEKLGSHAALRLLENESPQYLWQSALRGVQVQAVPSDSVSRYWSAREKARTLRDDQRTSRGSPPREAAVKAMDLLIRGGVAPERIGVSGSILIDGDHAGSDVDLVVYTRQDFAAAQRVFREWIRDHPLDEAYWRHAYSKREPAINFEQYIRHEQRKHNRLMLHGVKIDLSLSNASRKVERPVRRIGPIQVTARVTDDSAAFDFPSRWSVECDAAQVVECWTATYAGQVFRGERAEIQGTLEAYADGAGHQIVVGSNREAPNEYIRRLDW